MSNHSLHHPMSVSTLTRHRAFWNHEEMDRPSWGVTLGFFANEAYPRLMAKMPSGPVQPENILIPELLQDFDARWEAQQGIGDFPFTCSPFPAIPWLEAMAGCPIMASPTSFWAEPCLADYHTWQWPSRVLENPWAQKLLEVMRALAEHARGRYQVSPTLMRGPADILAAMRGASQFALDFLDTPEHIRPALEQCAALWREMAQAQLDLIPPSSEGYVALESSLRAWAPERLLWLQEDAMALLSPKLYREFILPLDTELSGLFPCIAFHLHGTALWAVDSLVHVPSADLDGDPFGGELFQDSFKPSGEVLCIDPPDDQRFVFLNFLPAGERPLHITICRFQIQLNRIDSGDMDQAINRPKGRAVEVEGNTRKLRRKFRIERKNKLPIEIG